MNYCNESSKNVVKRSLKTAKEQDVEQLGKLFHELRPVDNKQYHPFYDQT